MPMRRQEAVRAVTVGADIRERVFEDSAELAGPCLPVELLRPRGLRSAVARRQVGLGQAFAGPCLHRQGSDNM